MHIIHRGLIVPVSDNETDLRVTNTAGLNQLTLRSQALFFHCLSYPNGNQLRRAMPEGHWSLSTLPGNGLLVRMGLEGSLWFLLGPLLNQSWFGPEPQHWAIPGATEVESFSSWSTPLYFSAGAPSTLVCVWERFQSIIISFHTVYFGNLWDSATSVRLNHLI